METEWYRYEPVYLPEGTSADTSLTITDADGREITYYVSINPPSREDGWVVPPSTPAVAIPQTESPTGEQARR